MVRARELAAELAPERRLAGGVHEERALGERRLGEDHGLLGAERRSGPDEPEVARSGDAGLAGIEGRLPRRAVLARRVGERGEEPVQDLDAAGLLVAGVLTLHGCQDTLHERPQVRGDERWRASGIEIRDVDLAAQPSLVGKCSKGLVEEVVVDAVLQAVRHATDAIRDRGWGRRQWAHRALSCRTPRDTMAVVTMAGGIRCERPSP
jgi:hypothetical protein